MTQPKPNQFVDRNWQAPGRWRTFILHHGGLHDGVRIPSPPIARTVTNMHSRPSAVLHNAGWAFKQENGQAQPENRPYRYMQCFACWAIQKTQTAKNQLWSYTLHFGGPFCNADEENSDGSKLKAMLRSATRRIVVCWCPSEVYAPTQTRRIWSRMCHAAGS